MRNYIMSVPALDKEKRLLMIGELSLSVGRSNYFEFSKGVWIINSDLKASDIALYLEKVLTKDVEFFILELAEENDFVHNLSGVAHDWFSERL